MLLLRERIHDRKKHFQSLNGRFLRAVSENDMGTARRFLAEGADIHCRGRNAETALLMAARYGYRAMALLLLDRGALPNAQDRTGNTALMHAVTHDDLVMAARLIDAQADITQENKDGEQALTLAFRQANPDMIELFEKPLKKILMRIPMPRQTHSLENADPHGDTMLTWAARRGQINVIRALLESGTNAEVRNRAGLRAIDIARAAGHDQIVALLES